MIGPFEPILENNPEKKIQSYCRECLIYGTNSTYTGVSNKNIKNKRFYGSYIIYIYTFRLGLRNERCKKGADSAREEGRRRSGDIEILHMHKP